jgi:hypothetical protein
MGGKRHKPATPAKSNYTQIRLQPAWKRPNQSNTPARLLPAPPSDTAHKPWQQRVKDLDSSDTTLDTASGTANSTCNSSANSILLPIQKRGGDGTIPPYSPESTNKELVTFDELSNFLDRNPSASLHSSNNSSATEKIDNSSPLPLNSETDFPPLSPSKTPQSPPNMKKLTLPVTPAAPIIRLHTLDDTSANKKLFSDDTPQCHERTVKVLDKTRNPSRPSTKRDDQNKTPLTDSEPSKVINEGAMVSSMSSPEARAADQRACDIDQRANTDTPIVSNLTKVSELSTDADTPCRSKKKNSVEAISKDPQTDNSPLCKTQYNPFYHRKVPDFATQPSMDPYALDKKINLKNKQQRSFIHRYDLKFPVKKPKDDDAELLAIRSSLQKFLEVLLLADESIIYFSRMSTKR